MKKLHPFTEEQLSKHSIDYLNTTFKRFTKEDKTKYEMSYWLGLVSKDGCNYILFLDYYTKKEIKNMYDCFSKSICLKKLELFNNYVK